MDDSSPKSRTAKLQKLIREKGKNRLLNLERVIAILNNLSEYDFTDNDVLLLKEKLIFLKSIEVMGYTEGDKEKTIDTFTLKRSREY